MTLVLILSVIQNQITMTEQRKSTLYRVLYKFLT